MNQETTKCHVVLLPEINQRKTLVDLSVALNTDGQNSIELGMQHSLPHITLFNSTVPSDNIKTIGKELEQLVQGITLSNIEFDQYAAAPGGDSGLFVNYITDQQLLDLQNQVIEIVNRYREGIVTEKWQGNSEYAEEISRYGYPLSQYHFPHVTLAKFANQEARNKALEDLQKTPAADFRIGSIAVAQTGPHGTAQKVLREFPLV